MTLLELRARLQTALAGKLGTYKYADNSLDTAITVGVKTPPGTEVTGLEVAIQRTPEVEREFEFGSNGALNKAWVVLLKQWGAGEPGLVEEIEAVLREFPTAESPTIMPATDETIEQATFRIPFSEGL